MWGKGCWEFIAGKSDNRSLRRSPLKGWKRPETMCSRTGIRIRGSVVGSDGSGQSSFNSLPGIDNGELNGHITQKAVETVRKRVKDIYVEQGGVLNQKMEKLIYGMGCGKSKNLHLSIDEFNFRQTYKELSSIKFTRNNKINPKFIWIPTSTYSFT